MGISVKEKIIWGISSVTARTVLHMHNFVCRAFSVWLGFLCQVQHGKECPIKSDHSQLHGKVSPWMLQYFSSVANIWFTNSFPWSWCNQAGNPNLSTKCQKIFSAAVLADFLVPVQTEMSHHIYNVLISYNNQVQGVYVKGMCGY